MMWPGSWPFLPIPFLFQCISVPSFPINILHFSLFISHLYYSIILTTCQLFLCLSNSLSVISSRKPFLTTLPPQFWAKYFSSALSSFPNFLYPSISHTFSHLPLFFHMEKGQENKNHAYLALPPTYLIKCLPLLYSKLNCICLYEKLYLLSRKIKASIIKDHTVLQMS